METFRRSGTQMRTGRRQSHQMSSCGRWNRCSSSHRRAHRDVQVVRRVGSFPSEAVLMVKPAVSRRALSCAPNDPEGQVSWPLHPTTAAVGTSYESCATAVGGRQLARTPHWPHGKRHTAAATSAADGSRAGRTFPQTRASESDRCSRGNTDRQLRRARRDAPTSIAEAITAA
jgi:hypothetical protein